MSQYQRLISYLYRYENGMKSENTGYARIELRGDSCRVTVLLSDHFMSSPDIAFFQQRDEGVVYFPAGQLRRGNNGYSCRIESKTENMLNTGVSFADMDGLLVYLQEELYYATVWKEKELHLGLRRRFDEVVEEQSSEVAAAERNSEVAATPAPVSETSQSEMPMEMEQVKAFFKTSESEMPVETEQVKAFSETSQSETPAETEQVKAFSETSQSETPAETEQAKAFSQISQSETSAKKEQEDCVSACQCEACRQCPQRENRDPGHHIMSMFPKMYPFEIENMGECVRLELKDLGCLPVNYWSLAGNPFLLHGYYCYRHIIFTQLPSKGYGIGVPGIFGRENQKKAEECGFTRFYPLADVTDYQGAFGYWIFEVSELDAAKYV